MKRFLILIIALMTTLSVSRSVSAATDYTRINTEIFTLQRWIVQDIQSMMNIETLMSMRESGNMNLSTKISTPEASGSINLKIEEYKTTYDIKTGDVDAKFRGTMSLNMNTSRTDYDSYDTDTYEYGKKSVVFSLVINYDISLVVSSGGDVYFTISRLDAQAQWDTYTKAIFDEAMNEMKPYIGKTYKVGKQDAWSIDIDYTDIISSITNTLSILDTKPLFSVMSERSGVYALKTNYATMKELGWKMWGNIITYTNSGGTKTIWIREKKNAKQSYIGITESGWKYRFDMNASGRKNGKKEDIKISLWKDMVYMMMNVSELYFLADWKNNYLDMRLLTTPTQSSDDVAIDLNVKWPYSLDGSNTNLAVIRSGKNIWSIQSTKSGNNVSYSVNIDVLINTTHLILDWSAKYLREKWDFQVVIPTIYELLED